MYAGMHSEISFQLWLSGCQSFLIELCKISTAANNIGDFSSDRAERHSSGGEPISAEVSGGLGRLQSIPNPPPVCLSSRPRAEWD